MKRVLLFTLTIFVSSFINAQDFNVYSPWANCPNFDELIDIDNDGDLDIFTSNKAMNSPLLHIEFKTLYADKVVFIENTGNNSNPNFGSPSTSFSNINTLLNDMSNGVDIGAYRFKDMDNDGDQDLLVANSEASSSIYYYENIGNITQPNFERNTTFDFNLNRFIFDFQLFDIDDDNDFDLILNSNAGNTNCNPIACATEEFNGYLSVAENNNGFSITQDIQNTIIEEDICPNCPNIDIRYDALGIRKINDRNYLSYSTIKRLKLPNGKYDRLEDFHTAELIFDNDMYSITNSSWLPYQANGSVSLADLNDDNQVDLLNSNLLLESTLDYSIFNQITFNPINITPYVTSIPFNIDLFLDIIFGFDLFNPNSQFSGIYNKNFLNFTTKLVDINNNGTEDFVANFPWGIAYQEDFRNSNQPFKANAVNPFQLPTTLGGLLSKNAILKDVNQDGKLDHISTFCTSSNNQLRVRTYLALGQINNGNFVFSQSTTIFDEVVTSVANGLGLYAFNRDIDYDNDLDLILCWTKNNNNPFELGVSINENITNDFAPEYQTIDSIQFITTEESGTASAYQIMGDNSINILDYDSDGDFDITLQFRPKVFRSINPLSYIIKNAGSANDYDFSEITLDEQLSSPTNYYWGLNTIDLNNNGVKDLLSAKTNSTAFNEYFATDRLILGFNSIAKSKVEVFRTNWQKMILFENNSEPFFQLTNQPLNNNIGATTLSNSNLNVEHINTNLDAAQINYRVQKSTDFGMLINTNTNQNNVTNFTQADIDNGYIQYNGDANQADNFTFAVTYGAYEMNDQLFEITPVSSITNNELQISLAPNPTSDFLTIGNFNTADITYRILNLKGQVMQSDNLTNNQIDVQQLPKGSYILELRHQEEVQVGNFVKQ